MQHSWRYALVVTEDGAVETGRLNRRDAVADRLRDDIDQGKYSPGDQLPSYRDMATVQDVSAGTVRDAVHLLEREGRVEIRHGSGAYVRDVSAADKQLLKALAELADVRSQLNGIAAAVTDAERRVSQAMNRIRPGAD